MKKALLLTAALAASQLFAARPVAHWDTVPFRRIAGTERIGVVAFHEKGAKVVFSVDGKKKWIANRPSFNKDTGVVEYVFPLNTAKYSDGPVSVTASVETEGERPVELEPVVFYVNKAGKLGSPKESWVDPENGNDFAPGTKAEPVKTLKLGVERAGDGGKVYLMPGRHELKLTGGGLSRTYWTELTPAPGADRDSVELMGGRSGTDKLKFKNLVMVCDAGPGDYRVIADGENGRTSAWFDDCLFKNLQGRESGHTKAFGNGLRAYVTGGETAAMTDGPNGELVRNHKISHIAGEAFGGGDFLAVNVEVDDIDPEGTEAMESFLYQGFEQLPRWVGGAILYNIEATGAKGHAFTGRQLRDSAFVNVKWEGEENPLITSRFSLGVENVIFADVDIGPQTWEWVKQVSGREDAKPVDVRLYGVKAAAFTGRDGEDDFSKVTAKDDVDRKQFPEKQGK